MRKFLIVLLLLVPFCAATVAVAGSIPLPPSPAEVGKRLFRFYPDVDVYFDPVKQLHFFLEAGKWLSAPLLPPRITIEGHGHVFVEVNGDQPWREHKQHRNKYPPGQWKKNHGNVPPGHAKDAWKWNKNRDDDVTGFRGGKSKHK